MARGENSKITLKPTDTIILSSNVIPGNFENVELLVNSLYKKGVKVIENRPDCKIHASGHATRSEQQLMIRAVNPTYLFPKYPLYILQLFVFWSAPLAFVFHTLHDLTALFQCNFCFLAWFVIKIFL